MNIKFTHKIYEHWKAPTRTAEGIDAFYGLEFISARVIEVESYENNPSAQLYDASCFAFSSSCFETQRHFGLVFHFNDIEFPFRKQVCSFGPAHVKTLSSGQFSLHTEPILVPFVQSIDPFRGDDLIFNGMIFGSEHDRHLSKRIFIHVKLFLRYIYLVIFSKMAYFEHW